MIPSLTPSPISPEIKTPSTDPVAKKKIQSALDILMQHSAREPWKKEEIQDGLGILKEALADFSFSVTTYQKIHDIATTLLHLKGKDGGKYIPNDQKALLEHLSIASHLRASKEPLTKEQAEKALEQFREKDNKELIERWKKSGLDVRALLYNPEESRFIMKAHLDKAAHYWNHEIRFNEEDKTIHVCIEGEYKDIHPFVNSVYLKKTPLIPISSISHDFITDNDDPFKIWEYMPDRGLTLHNPADWNKLPVTGHLSQEEVAYAQKKATLHAKEAENGQYVVELVSLWKKPKDSALMSGLENIKSGEHPWIRIIKPDGTFYSVGFNLGKKILGPGAISKGVFLSPDPREPFARTARINTGIKINEEQFHSLVHQIEKDQIQEVDFHFLEQNCTKFLQSVVDMLQVETPQKPIFYARVSDVAFRALPTGVQKCFHTIKRVFTPIATLIDSCIPPVVTRIFTTIGTFFTLLGERLLLLFAGKQLFYLNKKDIMVQREDPHKGIPWYRVVTHIQIASENSLVQTFLPIKLIEWQMSIPGTRVYPGSSTFHDQYSKTVVSKA